MKGKVVMALSFVKGVFIAVFAFSFIIILIASLKSKHFFKSVFLTAFSGVGGLFTLQLLSEFTKLTLPVNIFTLAVSAVSGIPGVIGLLLTCFTV